MPQRISGYNTLLEVTNCPLPCVVAKMPPQVPKIEFNGPPVPPCEIIQLSIFLLIAPRTRHRPPCEGAATAELPQFAARQTPTSTTTGMSITVSKNWTPTSKTFTTGTSNTMSKNCTTTGVSTTIVQEGRTQATTAQACQHPCPRAARRRPPRPALPLHHPGTHFGALRRRPREGKCSSQYLLYGPNTTQNTHTPHRDTTLHTNTPYWLLSPTCTSNRPAVVGVLLLLFGWLVGWLVGWSLGRWSVGWVVGWVGGGWLWLVAVGCCWMCFGVWLAEYRTSPSLKKTNNEFASPDICQLVHP